MKSPPNEQNTELIAWGKKRIGKCLEARAGQNRRHFVFGNPMFLENGTARPLRPRYDVGCGAKSRALHRDVWFICGGVSNRVLASDLIGSRVAGNHRGDGPHEVGSSERVHLGMEVKNIVTPFRQLPFRCPSTHPSQRPLGARPPEIAIITQQGKRKLRQLVNHAIGKRPAVVIPASVQIDILELRKVVAHRFAIGPMSEDIRLDGEHTQRGVVRVIRVDMVHRGGSATYTKGILSC